MLDRASCVTQSFSYRALDNMTVSYSASYHNAQTHGEKFLRSEVHSLVYYHYNIYVPFCKLSPDTFPMLKFHLGK